jgi:hypothetical protein
MTGPRGSRDRRPEPSPDLDKAEFERWYWTQAELRQIARGLGISTGGRKDELAARVSAALAGRPLPKEAPRRRSRLEGPLSRETVIPEGLILSRNLREWFEGEVGADFRADRHLREFLQEGAGKTLGEAVDHYRPLSEIESQFELNRFTRRWWKANPGGTRAQLLEAWRLYRETPVERRPPPS